MTPASAVLQKRVYRSTHPRTPLLDPKSRKVVTPLSISSLAELCGVSRQRIYQMIKEGNIATIRMEGGNVVMPNEANRLLGCLTKIRVRGGNTRTCFDFSRI